MAETGRVNRAPSVCYTLFVSALFLCLRPALTAQNVLLAEYTGKAYPVISACDIHPYVEVEGKVVGADWRAMGLKKVDEYLPVFISVRGLRVNSSFKNRGGYRLNNEFHFRAIFETAYSLPNVFLVLELNNESAGKQLFLYGVGDLEPRQPKTIVLTVPLQFPMGKGRFKLHLFSNGAEVLQSEIPPERRERAVDRMIMKRIATVTDAAPKPFIGPLPEYPAALLKAKTKGRAIVTLHVGADGSISDPAVKSATDRAFGEAAVEAVRQWRFLPRVKNRQAVDSQVDMPFDFTPPSKPEEKS